MAAAGVPSHQGSHQGGHKPLPGCDQHWAAAPREQDQVGVFFVFFR